MKSEFKNNKQEKSTILIAAGGTGGHVFPSLSVINEIQYHNFIIITDQRSKDYFTNFLKKKNINIKIFTHKISSPSNKFIINKIKPLFQIIVSIIKSIFLIINYKPNVVIGFGGYPSVAPVLAAKIFNIPSIVHEQNSIIGRANKLLCKISNVLALSFLDTKNTKNISKSMFTGNPVRKEFYDIGKVKYQLPKKLMKINILVYGGSLGASFFSQYLTSIICALPKEIKNNLKISQQVRKEHMNSVSQVYKSHNIDYEISTFFDDISNKFKIAHLIITRAGGSTIAEILASNRPVILVPFPNSLDNHQLQNARFIEANNGGWVFDQTKSDINELSTLIKNILTNPQKLLKASKKLELLSKRLQNLRQKETPEKVLSDLILEIINDNQKGYSNLC